MLCIAKFVKFNYSACMIQPLEDLARYRVLLGALGWLTNERFSVGACY